ncbi:hypothetical protein AMELA_G00162850 [Ameiurus melas]|uniref:Uncharacterized protein n=1 Tax=Ameiurus melas TaxID=219545 RepID=A0A7J6AFC5_AMEME|nr:hypothetical protein AMELA_G00162850 [Ameiurus melas]
MRYGLKYECIRARERAVASLRNTPELCSSPAGAVFISRELLFGSGKPETSAGWWIFRAKNFLMGPNIIFQKPMDFQRHQGPPNFSPCVSRVIFSIRWVNPAIQ